MNAILTAGAGTILSYSAAARRNPDRPVSQDAHHVHPDFGLFLVADGLGGHDAGDLASHAVAEIVRRVSLAEASLEERCRAVEAALQAVNQALRRAAAQLGSGALVGTTVALIVVDDGQAAGMWVGDSRIYLLRAETLVQLTRDHSFAAEMGVSGSRGQVLTRAIGSSDDLDVDGFILPIEDEDTFLVCSDGVTKVVDAATIAGLMTEPVDGLAERIVARAVAAGGRDDITAIVVRIEAALGRRSGGGT